MMRLPASFAGIVRDPAGFAAEDYDLIVIGGGIQGVAIAFEAARRRLRTLLLERHDFGGATSFNSHRIIHGGLRYLQSLDVRRCHDSSAERNWFLKSFPTLIEPIACVMPLYGAGLKKPSMFRAGLQLHRVIARGRNQGLLNGQRLPDDRVLTPAEAVRALPWLQEDAIRGAGVWHDAIMRSSERVLINLLMSACHLGARALNYCEATDLALEGGRMAGVIGVDHETGESHRYHAPIVINATGPGSSGLTRRFHAATSILEPRLLAFTVVLRNGWPHRRAVAVPGRGRSPETIFVIPEADCLHVGTVYVPCSSELEASPGPTREQIEDFLSDVNAAIPAIEATYADVIRVNSGILPAQTHGSIDARSRDVLIDHESHAGPSGMFSVLGTKFTTARRCAEQAIRRIFGRQRPRGRTVCMDSLRPGHALLADRAAAMASCRDDRTLLRATIREVISREAVVHLDDLLLRRTNWAMNPRSAAAIAEAIVPELGWAQSRVKADMRSLQKQLAAMHPNEVTPSLRAVRRREADSVKPSVGTVSR